LLALVALLFLAADAPDSVVKYRQATMKAMGQHMTAMSLVVKRQIASRGGLFAHAEAVHATSKEIAALFPSGSGPDKVRTDAMKDVWARAAEFRAAAAKLERESAKLADAARKNDAKTFDAQFKVVNDTCNSCHDAFRTRD
jgi:cytochrome c556